MVTSHYSTGGLGLIRTLRKIIESADTEKIIEKPLAGFANPLHDGVVGTMKEAKWTVVFDS